MTNQPLSDIDRSLVSYLNHEFHTPIFVMKTLLNHLIDGQVPDKDHLIALLEEVNRFEALTQFIKSNEASEFSLEDLKRWKQDLKSK